MQEKSLRTSKIILSGDSKPDLLFASAVAHGTDNRDKSLSCSPLDRSLERRHNDRHGTLDLRKCVLRGLLSRVIIVASNIGQYSASPKIVAKVRVVWER